MTDITITPIGILHCDLQLRRETPRNYDISSEEGIIELYPQYIQGLDGIRAGDEILVLFWFNQARRDILRVHPRGDTNLPIRGVFATRSPVRPNPIALSRLRVLAIEQNLITVRGLDAMDKTPVLDIKMNLSKKETKN
jgi:L-fuculose-phosphate aldolase